MALPLRMATAAVAITLRIGITMSCLSLCRTCHEATAIFQLLANRLMGPTVLLVGKGR